MNLRFLRERKRLSQERLAEMSGLSLRTIQRVEAGHRVSYASLRALAAALQTDADVLERELYAVNNSTDEFVEIPRWIRLLDGRRWFGGRGLSRRDFLIVEAFCLLCAVIAFGALFLIAANRPRSLALVSALPLAGCYLTAVSIRVHDKYKLWPGAENAPAEKPRTWRTITAEYGYLFGLGILGTAFICWLIV